MNRILAGIILALTVALATLGWYAKYTGNQNALLKAENASLGAELIAETLARETDRAAWLARVRTEQALVRQKAAENATLQEALKQEPVWAAQPVPCSVVAALGLRDERCKN